MAIFASFSILNFIFPSAFPPHSSHSLVFLLFFPKIKYRHFNRVWAARWKFDGRKKQPASDDKHRSRKSENQRAWNFTARIQFYMPPIARSCIHFFFLFFLHSFLWFDNVWFNFTISISNYVSKLNWRNKVGWVLRLRRRRVKLQTLVVWSQFWKTR
jgi:hypothetical protein